MMTFPIVKFPFISSNILASPAYGVYISQLTRYSRAFAQLSNFLDRAQLLTQKLLKQNYVAPMLNSSLNKFYSRHHNLVDRYEISISQLTMDLLLFAQILMSYKRQDSLTLREHMVSPLYLVGFVLFIFSVFFYLFVFVLCLVYPMLPVSLDLSFMIAPLNSDGQYIPQYQQNEYNFLNDKNINKI